MGEMTTPNRRRGRGSVRSQILMRNVQRVLEQMENQDNQANAITTTRPSTGSEVWKKSEGGEWHSPSSPIQQEGERGGMELKHIPQAKRAGKALLQKEDPYSNDERGRIN